MNERKLRLHERVEVRQFEAGLRGSWHAGVVVGVSELCRSVKYDELLCERGRSRLVESIPVTEAIEGLHKRRHVQTTYRGHIRPLIPPCQPDACKPKLSFGICVDAFFEDAWWEGVIFDSNLESDERVVYFPDEDDKRKFNVNDLRITREWDEFLGVWKDRGVWILVELSMEIKGDDLSHFIKTVWVNLRLEYEFVKMISEWTCCIRSLWDNYFQKIVRKITIVKNQTRREEFSLEHKQKKLRRSIRLQHKKPEHPIIHISNKCMRVDNSSQEKESTACASLVPKNAISEEHFATFGFSGCRKRKVNSDFLPAENILYHLRERKIYPVLCRGKRKLVQRRLRSNISKLQTDRNKSNNRHVVHSSGMGETLAQNASLVQGNQPVGKRRNMMKPKQINSSITRKRAPKKFHPVITKKKPPPKGKMEVLDALLQEGVVCARRSQTLASEKSGQKIRLKEKVSSPPKGNKKRVYPVCHPMDTICIVCHLGEDLIFCDNCLSSYHLSCIDLKDVPDGRWFCSSCRCGLCGLRDPNCDSQLFTSICEQCGHQYHVDCSNKAGYLFSKYNPLSKFCSVKCSELCTRLRQLLGASNPTSMEGITWTLMKSMSSDCGLQGADSNDVRKKLTRALGVLRDCFEPVIDPHTEQNIIVNIIRSSRSKLKRLDFHGFYVIALQKGDDFACVATVRIHGHKVAEMPLVATDFQYRRQGMCALLVQELEKMLSGMDVERLTLPAVSQLKETWETSFGFTEMPHSERRELLSYPLLGFHGTTMFRKFLNRSTGIRQTQGASKTYGSRRPNLSQESGILANNNRRIRGLYYLRKRNKTTCGKENVDKHVCKWRKLAG